MMIYGMKYPSGQFEPAVLAVSSPNFLPTPSLLSGRCRVRNGESIELGKHCSASAKTSVLPTLF